MTGNQACYQVIFKGVALVAQPHNIDDVSIRQMMLRYIAKVSAVKLGKVEDPAKSLGIALQYFRKFTSMV